ncbi:polysaccharide biosynthesis/export family protein [Novosphingobium sp. KCTC 2891]|uniref:polysaccharide biosynthesis/export family protein n=1 Tax=Novosphingobium sp. KCTC 2891 TaxID=2989730 RepID=UPI0022223D72|nr:polysaccharide biosynthesis/export family protein [Novosphingobium sp. KCTC 2891]
MADQTIQQTTNTGGVPFDYHANVNSDVFGAQLFAGVFTKASSVQYNPDYIVTMGDRIYMRMWGAYSFNQYLVVDPQGDIFIPTAPGSTMAPAPTVCCTILTSPAASIQTVVRSSLCR